MSNKLFTSLLLIPITLLSTTSAFAENFSDVKPGTDYFVAINYLKEKGVLTGYEDNTFKPRQEITRAEALKMLGLASGVFSQVPPRDPTESPFTDTPLESWYTKYVALAKDQNIVNGCKNGEFKPEAIINLAETLKIYFNSIIAAGSEFGGDFDYTGIENFLTPDIDPESWFAPYIGYATAKNLINIYSSNTVNPNQAMTRGYLAEILYRFTKSNEDYDFGKVSYYRGIKSKKNDYYDQNMLTTAHQTLPKGSILEVTNLANGKTVKVKVTDRGPYIPGRVLDLSKIAFAKIAEPSAGVATIQYRVVE